MLQFDRPLEPLFFRADEVKDRQAALAVKAEAVAIEQFDVIFAAYWVLRLYGPRAQMDARSNDIIYRHEIRLYMPIVHARSLQD